MQETLKNDQQITDRLGGEEYKLAEQVKEMVVIEYKIKQELAEAMLRDEESKGERAQVDNDAKEIDEGYEFNRKALGNFRRQGRDLLLEREGLAEERKSLLDRDVSLTEELIRLRAEYRAC